MKCTDPYIKKHEMPDYRRLYKPGGTYFFTVVTAGRWPFFNNPEARSLLGHVMRRVAEELPFETPAIVLLHDHLHCLWTLPGGDEDFSTRWKRIKREFTVKWIDGGGPESFVTEAQRERNRRGIWQRRFWEHSVRDEADYEAYLDYIHYNPVKHGYVNRPEDWAWSSFRRYQRHGHYGEGWGRVLPRGLAGIDWE